MERLAWDPVVAPPTSAAGSGEPPSTPLPVALRLIKLLEQNISIIGATQRGCITLMRVVSAIHHNAGLISAFLDALRAVTPALVADEHGAFVLCHIISGLDSRDAPPLSPDAAIESMQRFRRTFVDTDARAAHLFDITRWAQESRHEVHLRVLRDCADPVSWNAFVDALFEALLIHLESVLRGRQQCFVLWHALRRLPVTRLHSGLRLLHALASIQPTVQWPPRSLNRSFSLPPAQTPARCLRRSARVSAPRPAVGKVARSRCRAF
jgi:hypothetical protein